MVISTTGKWSERHLFRTAISQPGFTLLELLVVAVLISIVLTIAIPNLQPLFFNDPLRKSARLVAAAVDQARERALESGNATIMTVDMSDGSLTIISPLSGTGQSEKKVTQSAVLGIVDPVSIDSVWTLSSGRIEKGQASIHINRRGMIEPVVINIKEAGRAIAVEAAPFRSDVRLFDKPLSLPSSVAVLSATAN